MEDTLSDSLSLHPTRVALVAGLGLLLLYNLIRFVRQYLRLSYIPGPFFASITNLARVSWVKTRRAHEIHHDLHRKYGDFVRFAPNMISVSNAEAIPTIYPMRSGFPKVSAQ
jgi:hypothetical protein